MQLIPLPQRFITGKSERTDSARQLHEFLGIGRDFTNWITGQINRFEFRDNQDFIRVFAKNGENPKGGRQNAEYWLTLDMAKELAMLSSTAMGREARRYFIDCERQLQEQQLANVQATQQPESLPAPEGPAQPSKAVRSAINRKAHAVSLQAYESAKAQIEAEVRGWVGVGVKDDAGLVHRIERFTYPKGEQRIVSVEDLWAVTSSAAGMRVMFESLMSAIHHLEQATGRECTGVPAPITGNPQTRCARGFYLCARRTAPNQAKKCTRRTRVHRERVP